MGVEEAMFVDLMKRAAVDEIVEKNRLDQRDRSWVERDVQMVFDTIYAHGGVVRRRVGL